jgi:hypothetical protein
LRRQYKQRLTEQNLKICGNTLEIMAHTPFNYLLPARYVEARVLATAFWWLLAVA